MKVKSRAYIKCDICGDEINSLFVCRRIKLYGWFHKWIKLDLCAKCATTLEIMVREKVWNADKENEE